MCCSSAVSSVGCRYILGRQKLAHSAHIAQSWGDRIPGKEAKIPDSTARQIIQPAIKATYQSINTATQLDDSSSAAAAATSSPLSRPAFPTPVEVDHRIQYVRSVLASQDQCFKMDKEQRLLSTIYVDAFAPPKTGKAGNTDCIDVLGAQPQNALAFDAIRSVQFHLGKRTQDAHAAAGAPSSVEANLQTADAVAACAASSSPSLAPTASGSPLLPLIRALLPSIVCPLTRTAGRCCLLAPLPPRTPSINYRAELTLPWELVRLLTRGMQVTAQLAHAISAHPVEPWAQYFGCTDDALKAAIRARETLDVDRDVQGSLADSTASTPSALAAVSAAALPSAAACSASGSAPSSSSSSPISIILPRFDGLTTPMVRKDSTHRATSSASAIQLVAHTTCSTLLPLCA